MITYEAEDKTQKDVFEDKSVKHVARAKKLEEVSLHTDFYSAIAFRRFGKREADVKDVFVNAWRIETLENEENVRTQIDSEDRDVEIEDGSNARVLISGEVVDTPCTVEIEWNWLQTERSRHHRKVIMTYRAETFMPTYSALSDDERDLCNAIQGRFFLLRDNHYGQGMPNLAEDIQTEYSLEDVAKAMQIAVSRINMNAVRPTDFIIGDSKGAHFPKMFYNYLMIRTLIELIRSIVYGYLETPDINGTVGVAYADRRSYYEKWRNELKSLEDDAKALDATYQSLQVRSALTSSSVLVGGGIYGNSYGLGTNQMTAAIERGWMQNFYYPINVVYSANGQ